MYFKRKDCETGNRKGGKEKVKRSGDHRGVSSQMGILGITPTVFVEQRVKNLRDTNSDECTKWELRGNDSEWGRRREIKEIGEAAWQRTWGQDSTPYQLV